MATLTGAALAGTAPKGLEIEILKEGNGEAAKSGQTVIVHYEGTLKDGSVFDSSRKRATPFRFNLGSGQVIPGWEAGIEGMKIGEKRRLTIAPELGYGASGAGDVIPPNATLIFEVELVDLQQPAILNQATPADLIQAQKAGVPIIDIRREDEWEATGIIAGAHTITAFTANGQLHPQFQNKFVSLITSPDMPFVLYCQSGERTTYLGNALVDQIGFTKASHLTGGVAEWLQTGHKLVPYKAK